MKSFKQLLLSALLLTVLACNHQQADQNIPKHPGTKDSILTIVNWNIEWLGSTRYGPEDKDLQQQNAQKILKYLNADIYCLCEIVDPSRLRAIVDGLGSDYDFTVADYASGAPSKNAANYAGAQKLAFVYNNKVFSHVSATGFLKGNSAAGYDFANGRYPYLFNADITKNGITENISFFLIHAKAGSDNTSYTHRLHASTALKTAIDEQYTGKNFIILGDFNDQLEGSITPGKASPYENFLQDDRYSPVSLALAENGGHSTLDYNSVIDQQIVSDRLSKYYRPVSAKIRTDITSVLPDFANGKTSDHYPVSSTYVFNKVNEAKLASVVETKNIVHVTKPLSTENFSAQLQSSGVDVKAKEKVENIRFVLYDGQNKKLLSVHRKFINAGDIFHLHTPALSQGKYDLVIFSEQGKQVIKLERN